MKPGRHICTVCNYIYEEPDQNKGDQDKKAAVAFDQLPAGWKCPSCGAGKDMYQPCSCVTVDSTHAHSHTGQKAHR